MGTYNILDHTADTGIEAQAGSLADLIGSLATGMFELIAEMDDCSEARSVAFEIAAESDEDLTYEALSELLYQSDVEDLLFCEVVVEVIGERNLAVTARGIPSGDADVVGPPIKAVTYHDIAVTEAEDGWHGRVYFDV